MRMRWTKLAQNRDYGLEADGAELFAVGIPSKSRRLLKSFLRMKPSPCVLRLFRVKYLSFDWLYTLTARLPFGNSRYLMSKSPIKLVVALGLSL